MPLYLDDPAKFRGAVARESAHAAVAEHFGMVVQRAEIDWRGFPVCHYGGTVTSGIRVHDANLVILVAGLVGERLAAGSDWRTPAGDLGGWMEAVEFDPNDTPDSVFHGDLVLALKAVGGDVSTLNVLEARAHELLTAAPRVTARWRVLRDGLMALRADGS